MHPTHVALLLALACLALALGHAAALPCPPEKFECGSKCCDPIAEECLRMTTRVGFHFVCLPKSATSSVDSLVSEAESAASQAAAAAAASEAALEALRTILADAEPAVEPVANVGAVSSGCGPDEFQCGSICCKTGKQTCRSVMTRLEPIFSCKNVVPPTESALPSSMPAFA